MFQQVAYFEQTNPVGVTKTSPQSTLGAIFIPRGNESENIPAFVKPYP